MTREEAAALVAQHIRSGREDMVRNASRLGPKPEVWSINDDLQETNALITNIRGRVVAPPGRSEFNSLKAPPAQPAAPQAAAQWAFLIDDFPQANWEHPCRYVFVHVDGTLSIVEETAPPVARHRVEKVRGIFPDDLTH